MAKTFNFKYTAFLSGAPTSFSVTWSFQLQTNVALHKAWLLIVSEALKKSRTKMLSAEGRIWERLRRMRVHKQRVATPSRAPTSLSVTWSFQLQTNVALHKAWLLIVSEALKKSRTKMLSAEGRIWERLRRMRVHKQRVATPSRAPTSFSVTWSFQLQTNVALHKAWLLIVSEALKKSRTKMLSAEGRIWERLRQTRVHKQRVATPSRAPTSVSVTWSFQLQTNVALHKAWLLIVSEALKKSRSKMLSAECRIREKATSNAGSQTTGSHVFKSSDLVFSHMVLPATNQCRTP